MGNQLQVCCTDGGNDNSNNQMDYNDDGAKRDQAMHGKKRTINRNKTKKRGENAKVPAQSSNGVAVNAINPMKNLNRSNSVDIGKKPLEKPQSPNNHALKHDLAKQQEEKQANNVQKQIEKMQGNNQ